MATIQGDISIITPTSGNAPLSYVEVSRQFDNAGSGTGPVWTFTYRGSKDALRVASFQWVNSGAKVTITESGPYSEATVVYSGQSTNPADPIETAFTPAAGTETPDIRYEFRTDYADVSLFAMPAVVKEANTFGDPNVYRLVVEGAAKNPGELAQSNIGTYPVAKQLITILGRGVDSFQVARVNLTRIATFSGNNGLPQVPSAVPPIYLPATFVAVWGLQSIQFMLPVPPSDPYLTPSGTTWGWKQTNYSTGLIVKTNQVEQTISWTFAPYDLLIYPFV